MTAKPSLLELHRFLLQSVYEQLRKIWPRGPDVGIEAVGNHYHEGSLLQKVEQAVSGETDPSEMLDEIIYCTRKVRVVLVVGILFCWCYPRCGLTKAAYAPKISLRLSSMRPARKVNGREVRVWWAIFRSGLLSNL